jgi:hypothetical protein
MPTLREEAKRLTALPALGSSPQRAITVAGAILFESTAPTKGVAVAVLLQCIAGIADTQDDFDRVRHRLALIIIGLHTVAEISKKRFLPKSLAARLASPFFLAPAGTYTQVL